MGLALLIALAVLGATLLAAGGVLLRQRRRGPGVMLLASGAAVAAALLVLVATDPAPEPQRSLEIRMEQPFSADALGQGALRLPDVHGQAQYLARDPLQLRLALPDGRVLDAEARDLFLGIEDGRARSVSFSVGGNHTRQEMDALLASVQKQLAMPPGPGARGCHDAGGDTVCLVIRAFENRYSLRVEVNPRRTDS